MENATEDSAAVQPHRALGLLPRRRTSATGQEIPNSLKLRTKKATAFTFKCVGGAGDAGTYLGAAITALAGLYLTV